MKLLKLATLVAIFSSVSAAQYQALPATTNYPALSTTLNGKPNMSSGSGAPSGSCTAFFDIYTDTATNNIWGCPQANTWQLWVYGTTFTNSEHSISGIQLFPDTHYSNVDVSAFPLDYGSGPWLAPFVTGWPAVSACTWTSGTATCTISTTSGITNGGSYNVNGFNPSGYNATSSNPYPTITVIDGTHFSYAVTSNPGSYVSGGFIAKNSGNRLSLNPGMAINLATNSTPTPATALSSGANAWESDIGAFPITGSMITEGGTTVSAGCPYLSQDCHLLVFNTDNKKLYECFGLSTTTAPYTCGSIAIWDVTSNNLRSAWIPSFNGDLTDTAGITSADVFGGSITDKVLTHAELYAGCPGGVGTCTPVTHALRMTFLRSSGPGGFIWPGYHGSDNAPFPIGMRVTLPLSYSDTCQNFDNIGLTFSSYPPAESLKWTLEHYGAIVADYGQNGGITADDDPAWFTGSPTDQTKMQLFVHCMLSQSLQVVREQPTQGTSQGAIK